MNTAEKCQQLATAADEEEQRQAEADKKAALERLPELLDAIEKQAVELATRGNWSMTYRVDHTKYDAHLITRELVAGLVRDGFQVDSKNSGFLLELSWEKSPK